METKTLVKISKTARLFTLFGLVLVLSNCDQDIFKKKDIVTDIDGNTYDILSIGNQQWLSANLKVTKLNDGSLLELEKDSVKWREKTTAAYCYYKNNGLIYGDKYGAFYNWYAVESEKLCPSGWHVATDDDWQTLISHIGGSANGGYLKAKEFDHWKSPNKGATDKYAFDARGSGYRNSNGEFVALYEELRLWTSTNSSTAEAIAYSLDSDTCHINRIEQPKVSGLSVRCVKD